MSLSFNLPTMIAHLRERWAMLPDHRKPNNNTRYSLGDAALSAFAVFFMQAPSFLAHQRAMETRKGQNNARTLFGIDRLPSDNQIRNLLDPLAPTEWVPEFWWLYDQLRDAHALEPFRDIGQTWLIALDGVTYFSSMQLSCPKCLHREDRSGTRQYYHSAITPVLVKSGRAEVIPLPPEFIAPQDGHTKQDCERVAARRWLTAHTARFAPHTVTFLGDDLYANQPFCQSVAHDHQQYFLCVAKPDSHVELCTWIAMLEKSQALETQTTRVWNGRFGEQWTYRWTTDVPLRAGPDALPVAWLDLTITHEGTQTVLYHNSWVTNHGVTADTVAALAAAGRARWKVENENNNTLKNHGYHLEHNFGHGHQSLAMNLFSLNVLAFLMHTAQELLTEAYRELRAAVATRQTFFQDLRTLTRYLLFDSWAALFRFMFEGLEQPVPSGLLVPD